MFPSGGALVADSIHCGERLTLSRRGGVEKKELGKK